MVEQISLLKKQRGEVEGTCVLFVHFVIGGRSAGARRIEQFYCHPLHERVCIWNVQQS
jgi:hypothetical protein